MHTDNKFFYRVIDHQQGIYFSLGYNATSIKEVIKDFREYISHAGDRPQTTYWLNSWRRIAEYLQGVELERSKTKFKEHKF